MPSEHTLYFKGGVTTTMNGGTIKFLMFLLNGNKEVSLSEGRKYGFIAPQRMDGNDDWTPNHFETGCSVVKVMLQEMEGFGHPKFQQFFYLALGAKMEPQTVVIKPRSLQARGLGYEFRAEAKFLKKSEILALLDPDSIGYKVVAHQRTPPKQILREIVTIHRSGPSKEVEVANHGAVRHLRIN